MQKSLSAAVAAIVAYRTFSITLAVVVLISLSRIPFGTFNQSSWIDIICHLLIPGLSAPIIVAVFITLDIIPRLRDDAFILLALFVGVTSEALWEVFEFFVDSIFNVNWQASNADTVADLSLSFFGAFLGGLLFVRLYGHRLIKKANE